MMAPLYRLICEDNGTACIPNFAISHYLLEIS